MKWGLELRGRILSASWMHELAASSRQYKIGERRLARHSEIFRNDSAVIKIMPAGRNIFYLLDSKLNKSKFKMCCATRVKRQSSNSRLKATTKKKIRSKRRIMNRNKIKHKPKPNSRTIYITLSATVVMYKETPNVTYKCYIIKRHEIKQNTKK